MNLYYHTILYLKERDYECIYDLSETKLRQRIIDPYHNGKDLFLNGTAIQLINIDRVEIRRTDLPINDLVQKVKNLKSDARERQVNTGFLNFNPIRVSKEQVFKQGEDVLEYFISGPPKMNKSQAITGDSITEKSDKIFIVHGHNNEIKESVARFLEKSGLNPIILHEQPNHGKTIIEKFEEYADAQFAIVILSGDDYGYARTESENNKLLRARQNVILEMGYFIGKIGRKNVCILHEDISELEMPSDYGGVMYIKFNEAWKVKLAKELKVAKYNINLDTLLK